MAKIDYSKQKKILNKTQDVIDTLKEYVKGIEELYALNDAWTGGKEKEKFADKLSECDKKAKSLANGYSTFFATVKKWIQDAEAFSWYDKSDADNEYKANVARSINQRIEYWETERKIPVVTSKKVVVDFERMSKAKEKLSVMQKNLGIAYYNAEVVATELDNEFNNHSLGKFQLSILNSRLKDLVNTTQYLKKAVKYVSDQYLNTDKKIKRAIIDVLNNNKSLKDIGDTVVVKIKSSDKDIRQGDDVFEDVMIASYPELEALRKKLQKSETGKLLWKYIEKGYEKNDLLYASLLKGQKSSDELENVLNGEYGDLITKWIKKQVGKGVDINLVKGEASINITALIVELAIEYGELLYSDKRYLLGLKSALTHGYEELQKGNYENVIKYGASQWLAHKHFVIKAAYNLITDTTYALPIIGDYYKFKDAIIKDIFGTNPKEIRENLLDESMNKIGDIQDDIKGKPVTRIETVTTDSEGNVTCEYKYAHATTDQTGNVLFDYIDFPVQTDNDGNVFIGEMVEYKETKTDGNAVTSGYFD